MGVSSPASIAWSRVRTSPFTTSPSTMPPPLSNRHHQCFQSSTYSPRLLAFLQSPLVWCILLRLEDHLWLQSSLNSSTPYLKPSTRFCLTTMGFHSSSISWTISHHFPPSLPPASGLVTPQGYPLSFSESILTQTHFRLHSRSESTTFWAISTSPYTSSPKGEPLFLTYYPSLLPSHPSWLPSPWISRAIHDSTFSPIGTESLSFTMTNRLTCTTSICKWMLLLLLVLGVCTMEDGLQHIYIYKIHLKACHVYSGTIVCFPASTTCCFSTSHLLQVKH